MSELPQSNAGCTEEECVAFRKEQISATVSREQLGTEVCSLGFNHRRGPADVSVTALHCLRKDVEPHVDCSGSGVSLSFNDISVWQGSPSALMSSSALMTQMPAIRSICSKPTYMIQVKIDVVCNTGPLHYVLI